MKTAIVYHSSHHGNTKKLVDAIVAAHNDIAVFEAESCRPDDLSSFDLIGFASGIYYFSFHKSILDIAAALFTKAFWISPPPCHRANASSCFRHAAATSSA